MDFVGTVRSMGKKWYISAPLLALAVGLASVAQVAAEREYMAQGSLILASPEHDASRSASLTQVVRSAAGQVDQGRSLADAELHVTLESQTTVHITAISGQLEIAEELAREATTEFQGAVNAAWPGSDDLHVYPRASTSTRELSDGNYLVRQDVSVEDPSTRRSNPFAASLETARLLGSTLQDDATHDRLQDLTGRSARFAIDVDHTDQAPVLSITTFGADPDAALESFHHVYELASQELMQRQREIGVSDSSAARLEVLEAPEQTKELADLVDRSSVAVLVLGILLAAGLSVLADSSRSQPATRKVPLSRRPAGSLADTRRERSETWPSSRTGPHRWSPSRWIPAWDAVAFLSVWLVLLYGISAAQIVGPLGDIGTPAMLLAALAAASWWAGRILPESDLARSTHPLRSTLLIYAWVAAGSFVVALARPLSEIEQFGATRSLLNSLILTGLAMLVIDGIHSIDRCKVLFRRLVIVGAAMVSLGILQFFTGLDLTFSIPGLRWNHEYMGVVGRSNFNRPSSTTLHPIEFSVVAAALFPLAFHFFLYPPDGGRRKVFLGAMLIIGLAIPLSVSRSGLVSIVAAMCLLSAGWTWQLRARALTVGAIMVPLLWLAIPGLVGTLSSMFTNHEVDDSIQARIERLPRIIEVIRERPWLGRGEGTFNVEEYFLIDNGFYVKIMETGIVGTTAWATLLAIGIYMGLAVSHQPGATEEIAHLGRAIAAGILAVAISFFTFDAGTYRILMGTLFLLIGGAGALWRLTAAQPSATLATSPSTGSRSPSR